MPGNNLPNFPGTYALLLELEQGGDFSIGWLGEFEINPGYYLYLGSAFGPGGLRGRLSHHLRPVRRPRWHIDYLRPACQLIEIWYTLDPLRREHLWAEAARYLPLATVPIPKFGASDCRCISHLIYDPYSPRWDNFYHYLISVCPEHSPLFRLLL